ncbi:MAG TPA: succinylglutamate desuccinylase/aspartoacylase family protein [Stellaceae bacterium]|jgi:predicted deacylase|nr:succinylglutamate desuccinylase/aspartoacylase family protein [Stellaceae bacterium]
MKSVETRELASTVPGTTRRLTIRRYGPDGEAALMRGPKAYIQASLHADELPAMLAATHLIRLLDAAEAAGAMQGDVVVLPVANPIGLDQSLVGHHFGRYELHSGENFNRDFADLSGEIAARLKDKLGPDPGENVRLIRATMMAILDEARPRGELASLRVMLMREAADADYLLDLHCDDEALPHLYLGDARWPDGADLAAEIGSVAILLTDEAGGGLPFDEAFGNLWALLRVQLGDDYPIPDACLAATVELRGQGDVSDELAAADAAALFRYLQRQGIVAGDPGPLPDPLCEGTRLDGVDMVRAPVAGIIVYKAELGRVLLAGEVVADILDPLTGRRTPVMTETDGVLFARVHHRWIRPGQHIAKVAGTMPLASRIGAALLDP